MTNDNIKPPIIKRPKRCQMLNCKKRLLLTDMKCRCDNFFCGLHRLPEQHKCSFNFKNENCKKGKQEIIDSLKCVNEKIEKI